MERGVTAARRLKRGKKKGGLWLWKRAFKGGSPNIAAIEVQERGEAEAKVGSGKAGKRNV